MIPGEWLLSDDPIEINAGRRTLRLSVRNIEGVQLLASNRISARDVMNTRRVVLTKAALEKLQEALG